VKKTSRVSWLSSARSPRPKFLGPLKKQSRSFAEQLLAYLMSNMLSVMWTIVLIVGTLSFLLYSWGIGYLPTSLSIETATPLLAAISVIGIFVTFVLSVSLVMPGLIANIILDGAVKSAKLKYFFVALATIFFSLYPLLVVFVLASKYEETVGAFDEVRTVGVALVFLVAVNVMIAKKNSKGFLVFSFIFAPLISWFLLLILFKQWDVITQKTMQRYKFGQMKNVTLLLDYQGVQIARQYINPVSLRELAASSVASVGEMSKVRVEKKTDKSYLTEGCLFKPITILSRLGNEYYVEVNLQEKKKDMGEEQKTNEENRFVIPSSHVLSWRMRQEDKGVSTRLICP